MKSDKVMKLVLITLWLKKLVYNVVVCPLASLKEANYLCTYVRAVARSENPGGLVVMGGDNVPTLVEIG